MSDYKNYLPSRKFTTILLVIVVFIVLFFTVRGIISYFKNKQISKESPTTMTVGTLIQKDSNKNGIADWEEYLWGLDPNKTGQENKEFILAKKKTLLKNGEIYSNDDSRSITENEELSMQFFAAIMSLQQTGNLNEESLKSISDSIGKEIEATPIDDIYTRDMLIIKEDSNEADIAYFGLFSALVDKYANEDIGSELTLISQGIVNQDPQALYAARTVASAYRAFGEELLSIPVPSSAATLNLSLANNYEKTAQSIDGLTKVLSDPIVGMRSVLNYKKYTDAIGVDMEKLSEILQ
ncbi:MAG: hypothetical protein UR85_C0002G0073 [Candidatus Nomurabacteria bacterium GW2011_GWF2_35_66]|uniref:Uncharacterized protein n=1 Tax=Candidatus Nomurabacteria bacterium GW2011_GWE1_35_16 TaxID=1618761 RepID=A0A0G0EHC4_9BACT|nr:MAG: hypothetical protein UR55_C0004G0033 [Candidatus Nomurabacteria bacterium GW2011_GWF1_34_20]KKP63472.1 MAG: hypothetical protein UR57_C0004G0033 [Candidatus Nomurabacteria bacterium GW2011_GWE2_34_25]KKP66652.1 MAG: hypothetical protein UR64_C0004G0033 [Candidatus Nomurabacteria bacterium GW2011_GWE1_35_16]KKP83760.1 MAG: hypothetical protein UR85_C0002G0073 [Candidatus Nomurabacteria bacterium GW2011_GWF2_35_66]HAE36451.1 hypothetical protein [Candidatus Nomurabacteria bacterium]